MTPIIGSDTDVFLSQLVWKLPGAEGQPWHQDAAIFPFDPPGPVIALWLALTTADDATGCLRVVAGSHRGQSLSHEPQVTARSNGRYVGVVDQHVDGGVALPVSRGDAVSLMPASCMPPATTGPSERASRSHFISPRREPSTARPRCSAPRRTTAGWLRLGQDLSAVACPKTPDSPTTTTRGAASCGMTEATIFGSKFKVRLRERCQELRSEYREARTHLPKTRPRWC